MLRALIVEIGGRLSVGHTINLFWFLISVVEYFLDMEAVAGSNPAGTTKYGAVAQSGRGIGLKHRTVRVRIPFALPIMAP